MLNFKILPHRSCNNTVLPLMSLLEKNSWHISSKSCCFGTKAAQRKQALCCAFYILWILEWFALHCSILINILSVSLTFYPSVIDGVMF